MAKNRITIDVRTANSGASFTRTSDFQRSTKSKTFQSTLASTVAHEAAADANIRFDKKLSQEERNRFALSKYRIGKTTNTKAIRQRVLGQEKKLAIGVNDDENATYRNYKLLLEMFYRIVCRTPYDEDYAYSAHYSLENFKKGHHSKLAIDSFKDRTFVAHHKKDTDVVKDEWYMSIETENGVYTYCKTDFSNIPFESIKTSTDLLSIVKRVYLDTKGEPIKDYKIWNTNPRVDQLEFGRYKKKKLYENTEQHRGEHRFHGTYNGYSVQAPRGFIALTVNELKETELENEENRAKGVNERDTLVFNTEFNVNKKLYDEILSIKKKGQLFDEKDILANIMGVKKTAGRIVAERKESLSPTESIKKQVKVVGKGKVADEKGVVFTVNTSAMAESGVTKREENVPKQPNSSKPLEDDIPGLITVIDENGEEHEFNAFLRYVDNPNGKDSFEYLYIAKTDDMNDDNYMKASLWVEYQRKLKNGLFKDDDRGVQDIVRDLIDESF